MAVKTRDALKAENAADFPDNASGLISALDIRDQLNDIIDSTFLAEDLDTPGGPAGSGGVGGSDPTKADKTTTITGGELATGGGDLSADRIITVAKASGAETAAGTVDDKGVTPLALATPLGAFATQIASLQTQINHILDILEAPGTPPPVNTVAPVASGSTLVGSVLSVTTGTWDGSPTGYAYQWKRGAAIITGATATTYTLVTEDIGTSISCAVTASNAGGSATATSNAISPIGTGSAPILTGPSVAAYSDIFAWLQVITDTAGGTLYAVVCPAAATPPSAAQIEAGQDGSGAAATVAANVAIASIGVKLLQLRTLSAATAYAIYATHKTGAHSNVVSVSFTSDVLINAWAMTGATTGMVAAAGSKPFDATSINKDDPYGGTGAIQWVDSGDTVTGGVLLQIGGNLIPFFNGISKVSVTCKYGGGAGWHRIATASATVLANAHWDTQTGAIGTLQSAWSNAVTFDLGNGWRMFTAHIDMTGAADLTAMLNISKGTNNNITTVPRNGTHISDIYGIRVTRAGP